jgi:hypothetical protein
MLAVLAVVWVTMVIGVTVSMSSLRAEVTDLPTVFSDYARFLEKDIIPPFNCTGNMGTTLGGTSRQMLDDDVLGTSYCTTTYASSVDRTVCGTNQTTWRELLHSIGNNSETFAYTMHNVTDTLESGVRQLYNTKTDADDFVSQTESVLGDTLVIVLAVMLLCGVCPCLLSARAAKKEASSRNADYTQHTRLICVGQEANVLIMWLVFLLCAVAVVYLRGTGGFCADPMTIIRKSASGNESDPLSYYTSCGGYSEAELVAYWPWETQRRDSSEEFTRLDSNVTTLKTQWGGNATTMEELETQSRDIGCTLSTSGDRTLDRGILSPGSILSCQMGDRFVQDVIIRMCESSYTPMDRIMAFLFILGVVSLHS